MTKFFATRSARVALTTVLTVATVALWNAAAHAQSSCERIALTQSARPGETVLVCEAVKPSRPSKPTIVKINKNQTACQRMPTLCSAMR